VKELGGALPHERRAAGADRFAVVTTLQMVGMDVEKPHALLAEAQCILFIHVAAAAGTDKGPESLGVIRIDSLTAYPALEDPDAMMAVIDHMPETALLKDHRPSFFLCWLSLPFLQLEYVMIASKDVYSLSSIVQIFLHAVGMRWRIWARTPHLRSTMRQVERQSINVTLLFRTYGEGTSQHNFQTGSAPPVVRSLSLNRWL
jgi:hypothetical protein